MIKHHLFHIITNNIGKDYILGKTLGEGSFGTVRKAVHKVTKQERAIKILKKSGQDEEKLYIVNYTSLWRSSGRCGLAAVSTS